MVVLLVDSDEITCIPSVTKMCVHGGNYNGMKGRERSEWNVMQV